MFLLFNKLTPNDVSVVVGSIYLNSGGTEHQISKIIIHPDHNNHTEASDIALVITSEAITSSSSVGFISLPSSTTGAGVKLTMTGWGLTSWPGKNPNTLQKITLSTISVEDCKKNKLPSTSKLTIFDTNICTLTKAGEGICRTDSGSPLVDGNVLVGIASWAVLCAKGYPDVFTRVSSYVAWINNINKNIQS